MTAANDEAATAGAAAGAVAGAPEGAEEGAAEGAAEGAEEGAAEGAEEGAAVTASEAGGSHPVACGGAGWPASNGIHGDAEAALGAGRNDAELDEETLLVASPTSE